MAADEYVVWAVADGKGPILYVAVPSSDARDPSDHVAFAASLAAGPAEPAGLVYGNWAAARGRLATGGVRLRAELADMEVPARSAVTRTAALARGTETSAAWVPDELLTAPEPTVRAPRKAAPRAPREPRAQSGPRRAAATKPPSTARPARRAEPEERPCNRCFMVRRLDQLDETGACAAGC